MTNYFGDTLKVISNSLDTMDTSIFEALLDDCIKVLNEEKRIIFTGLGKNVPVCEKVVGTMWSLGLNAAFLHTNNAVHGDIGMIQDGDLVIVLSKSGETSESKHLLKHLKKRNVCDWAITFNKDSSLAKGATNALSLELESEGDPWNIVPNNSTAVYLILLQTLVMHICKRLDVDLNVFKKNHPGGHIGEKLNGKQ